jgi:hypothetical protein
MFSNPDQLIVHAGAFTRATLPRRVIVSCIRINHVGATVMHVLITQDTATILAAAQHAYAEDNSAVRHYLFVVGALRVATTVTLTDARAANPPTALVTLRGVGNELQHVRLVGRMQFLDLVTPDE